MKKLSAILLVLVLFNSCKEDDEPRVDVFTVEFGEGFLSSQSENWIIISSTNGELLDYQLLQTGILTFQATEIPFDNKLNISILTRGTSSPSSNFFSMTTYTGIQVGESWSFEVPQFTLDTETGSANVQIINLPPIETVGVYFSKELEGRVYPQGNLDDKGATSEGNFVVPISQTQTDILITVSPLYLEETNLPNFEPRYYWLNDLNNGQQISLDFTTDFSSYDQKFELDIPDNTGNVSLSVSGFQDLNATYPDADGFLFTSSTAIIPITNMEAFFNDGFNFYETGLSTGNNNGSTRYRKVGDAPTPEDLAPRNLDFQMQNTSFNNYAFTANPEFQVIENGWFYALDENGTRKTLSWRIYTDRNDVNFPVLTNFPEQLVRENPVLSTDNLDNTYNRFIYNIDDRSYQDYIDRIIQIPPASKQLEESYALTKF